MPGRYSNLATLPLLTSTLNCTSLPFKSTCTGVLEPGLSSDTVKAVRSVMVLTLSSSLN